MEYEIELKYNFIHIFVCNKYWPRCNKEWQAMTYVLQCMLDYFSQKPCLCPFISF